MSTEKQIVMGPESANIIILNEKDQILLHLRDDKPNISCPNMWALPGGYIEPGETPEQCIFREMVEELGVELEGLELFVEAQRSYGFEHTFWSKTSFRVEDIVLTEGQAIQWFPFEEIENMKLGYEDNIILKDFFKKYPSLASFNIN
jgi:8-oxo-dGTP diphosphatase